MSKSNSKASRISERYITSFYDAINQTYLAILEARPQYILVPFRGAEPILRGVQLLASLDRNSSKMPRVIPLMIGEIDREISDHPYSFSEEEKRADIMKRLGRLKLPIGHPSFSIPARLLIIDEVQKGGSMSKNFGYVESALKKLRVVAELSGIAIAETGKKRHERFSALERERRIRPIFVEKLFTVDKQHFLPDLQRVDSNRTKTRIPNSAERMELFENLQRIHMEKRHPDELVRSKSARETPKKSLRINRPK